MEMKTSLLLKNSLIRRMLLPIPSPTREKAPKDEREPPKDQKKTTLSHFRCFHRDLLAGRSAARRWSLAPPVNSQTGSQESVKMVHGLQI